MTEPPLKRGTSALVIAQAIRNDIHAGKLVHGRQMPSTRELAAEWNTSVATINRAMGILAEEGLVVNRARSSRIVHCPPTPEAVRDRAKVILIGGYAGSGKTELGRILARRTGFAILDKDSTTRPVVEAALEQLGTSPNDRESDTYLSTIRPAEYEALMTTATENASCGVSVVVTAPFLRELRDQAWCDRTAATIDGLGADLHTIWVRCDADSMRRYLRHRGAARDAAKLTAWENYLEGVDLEYRPALSHRIIDNSAGARPLQEQAAELLAAIGVR
jgi:predicted kinase